MGSGTEHLSQCLNHSTVQTRSIQVQWRPRECTFELYLFTFAAWIKIKFYLENDGHRRVDELAFSLSCNDDGKIET